MNTKPRTVTTIQNQRVQIPCTARGIPRPTITWKKKRDGQRLRGRETSNGEYVTSTITISRPQTRDAGVYICTATNKVTTARPIKQEITLVVQGIFLNYIFKKIIEATIQSFSLHSRQFLTSVVSITFTFPWLPFFDKKIIIVIIIIIKIKKIIIIIIIILIIIFFPLYFVWWPTTIPFFTTATGTLHYAALSGFRLIPTPRLKVLSTNHTLLSKRV